MKVSLEKGKTVYIVSDALRAQNQRERADMDDQMRQQKAELRRLIDAFMAQRSRRDFSATVRSGPTLLGAWHLGNISTPMHREFGKPLLLDENGVLYFGRKKVIPERLKEEVLRKAVIGLALLVEPAQTDQT